MLAFVVSKWKCDASWWGYYSIEKWPSAWINWKEVFLYDQVKEIKNKWWKFFISFWWASWTPLFVSCNTEQNLLDQYERVIKNTWIKAFDFDIEWSAIQNSTALDRLISTLKLLQKKHNNQLTIWFTLPVMPEWLTQDWINFVDKLIKSWLKFDGINLMTMDYGSSYNKDMWEYAIQALKNTTKQIKQIYQKYGIVRSDFNLHKMLWATPMIGLNDITTENFTLEDAKQLSKYVKENNYWRISYWDLNRDHPCSDNSVKLKCSSKNNQAKDYDYLYAFRWTSDYTNTQKSTNTVNTTNNNVQNNSNKTWSTKDYQSKNQNYSNNTSLSKANNTSNTKTATTTYNSQPNNTTKPKIASTQGNPPISKNQSQNNYDIESIINDLTNKIINPANKWKEKIENLQWNNIQLNLDNTLNKYYQIFKNFWISKKNIILKNEKYQNEDYLNYLKSFNDYTNWLFTDLYYKTYSNIYSYLDFFKKVAKKLKAVR